MSSSVIADIDKRAEVTAQDTFQMMAVAAQVADYLEANNVSKEALAQKLGVSNEAVDFWLSVTYDFAVQVLSRIVVAVGGELNITIKKRDKNEK